MLVVCNDVMMQKWGSEGMMGDKIVSEQQPPKLSE